MNTYILKSEILCGVFIFLAGALSHFIFTWSGKWAPIGLITPVNESVWEHLKMVMLPAVAFSAAQYSYLKNFSNNFFTAKTASMFTAMISIVVIFYAYTYFTEHSILIVDIITFLLAVAAGQYVSYRILTMEQLPDWVEKVSISLALLLILSFLLFTFYPPRLPIFKNPVDGSYGI